MNRRQSLILIFLAALWGGSFLFMRIAAPVLGPIWLIEFRVLIAGLILLPALLPRGQLSLLTRYAGPLLIAGLLNAALPFCLLPFYIPTQAPDLQVTLSVIALAALSTSLAFALYFRLIQEIGPSRTLLVTYLIPVFAILWGIWFLDEAVTVNVLAGCALVLLGTALATDLIPPRRRKRQP